MDGYELFKKIREKLKIPVIFLTSKDQEADRLKGLMQGVDDYVTKGGNFSKEILLETIKNTLNRIQLVSDEQDGNDIIVYKDLRLDCSRQECEWKGKILADPLTTTEFKIIKELVQRPGIVKTRDRLMDIAYRDEIDVDDRTIDSHVKRIRKKFKKIDQEFQSIHTLYGSGYQWK
jgi:two-component system response regulator ChvI